MALTATVLTSIGAYGVLQGEDLPTPPSQELELGQEGLFAEAQAYWLGRGVDLTGAKLKLLDYGESVNCRSLATDEETGFNYFYASLAGGGACEDMVVMPEIYSFEAEGAESKAEFILAHEVAHLAEFALRAAGNNSVPGNGTANELMADCLGAQFLAASGRDIRRYDAVIDTIDYTTTSHGALGQRPEAVAQGAAGADCLTLYAVQP
jgi:hypothetical protein